MSLHFHSFLSFFPSFLPSKMYTLIPSASAPHEWVIRLDISKKNNISWDLELEFGLREMALPAVDNLCNGWTPASHSPETYHKLMPSIKSNPRHFKDYRGLFAFQKTLSDGRTVIKGAVQHRLTGKVALMTAINSEPTTKHLPSQVDGWYVFNAYMIAPMCFWDAFKAC